MALKDKKEQVVFIPCSINDNIHGVCVFFAKSDSYFVKKHLCMIYTKAELDELKRSRISEYLHEMSEKGFHFVKSYKKRKKL